MGTPLTPVIVMVMPINMQEQSPLGRWREAAGLTQNDVAARVGVTQSRYSDWERGHGKPALNNAIRLEEISEGAVPLELWGFGLDDLSGATRVLNRRRRAARAAEGGAS
jgi:transcriptional regulator with XRE-family HTH domain